METVLVTGAGFLGSYIARQLLEKGYHVALMDIAIPKRGSEENWIITRRNSSAFKYIKGDICDLASVLRIVKTASAIGIIHTAALTDVDLLAQSPTYALRVNTVGTVNILEAARLLGIKKIVISSSIAVYSPVQYEPIDEAHPVLSPESGPALTSYSASKVAAEAFGMHYWAEYNLGFIALRLSGIYGLGMRYPLYIKPVIEGVAKGEEVNLGAVGDTIRDLIYVEDAARAMIGALEANSDLLTSRIFNIGSGILHSASTIVNTVRKLEPDSRIHVTDGMTDTERIIQKSRGRLSVEKAKSQLSFEPAYSLEQGLGRYLSLYKSYLKHKG